MVSDMVDPSSNQFQCVYGIRHPAIRHIHRAEVGSQAWHLPWLERGRASLEIHYLAISTENLMEESRL